MTSSLIVESLLCAGHYHYGTGATLPCNKPIDWLPGHGWMHAGSAVKASVNWVSARWHASPNVPGELAQARIGREMAA